MKPGDRVMHTAGEFGIVVGIGRTINGFAGLVTVDWELGGEVWGRSDAPQWSLTVCPPKPVDQSQNPPAVSKKPMPVSRNSAPIQLDMFGK
jgi:hypothetical protein